MNYLKHYIKLIRTRQDRLKTDKEIYEKHHIFPVSLFGNNKSLVILTPREHFVAHILLYKICQKRYGNNHHKTKKMGNAVSMMICSSNKIVRRFPSRYYDQARKIWSKEFVSPSINPQNRRFGPKNHMWQIGKNHPLYGLKMKQSTKNLIGKSNKGKLLGEKNPSKRQDVKDKISQAKKGKKLINMTLDKHHKSILTNEQRKEIISNFLDWKSSLYAFAINQKNIYHVSRGAIQGVVYPKDKLERNIRLLFSPSS